MRTDNLMHRGLHGTCVLSMWLTGPVDMGDSAEEIGWWFGKIWCQVSQMKAHEY